MSRISLSNFVLFVDQLEVIRDVQEKIDLKLDALISKDFIKSSDPLENLKLMEIWLKEISEKIKINIHRTEEVIDDAWFMEDLFKDSADRDCCLKKEIDGYVPLSKKNISQ